MRLSPALPGSKQRHKAPDRTAVAAALTRASAPALGAAWAATDKDLLACHGVGRRAIHVIRQHQSAARGSAIDERRSAPDESGSRRGFAVR